MKYTKLAIAVCVGLMVHDCIRGLAQSFYLEVKKRVDRDLMRDGRGRYEKASEHGQGDRRIGFGEQL